MLKTPSTNPATGSSKAVRTEWVHLNQGTARGDWPAGAPFAIAFRILGSVLALDNSPLGSVVVQAIRIDTNAVEIAPPATDNAPLQPGLMGEYFPSATLVSYFSDARTLLSPTLRRVERSINFSHADGPFADTELRYNFYVRWTGFLRIAKAGRYTFHLQSDDGSRL